MIRLGILGSTRGSMMLEVIEAIKQKKLAAMIQIVLSNKSEALILKHAELNNLSYQFVDPHQLTRDEYDQKISTLLLEHHVDLILLIGYMRILSPGFVERWENKIINVHPSLLPAFAGKMDLDVHKAVLAAGMEETGCTVHYVTAEVDAGPIIMQKKCMVLQDDTPQRLKQRVQCLESEALIEVIGRLS
jgi:phosphoribosylglycinamide formyltransferase-1